MPNKIRIHHPFEGVNHLESYTHLETLLHPKLHLKKSFVLGPSLVLSAHLWNRRPSFSAHLAEGGSSVMNSHPANLAVKKAEEQRNINVHTHTYTHIHNKQQPAISYRIAILEFEIILSLFLLSLFPSFLSSRAHCLQKCGGNPGTLFRQKFI